jgi:hypothetical protein
MVNWLKIYFYQKEKRNRMIQALYRNKESDNRNILTKFTILKNLVLHKKFQHCQKSKLLKIALKTRKCFDNNQFQE